LHIPAKRQVGHGLTAARSTAHSPARGLRAVRAGGVATPPDRRATGNTARRTRVPRARFLESPPTGPLARRRVPAPPFTRARAAGGRRAVRIEERADGLPGSSRGLSQRIYAHLPVSRRALKHTYTRADAYLPVLRSSSDLFLPIGMGGEGSPGPFPAKLHRTSRTRSPTHPLKIAIYAPPCSAHVYRRAVSRGRSLPYAPGSERGRRGGLRAGRGDRVGRLQSRHFGDFVQSARWCEG